MPSTDFERLSATIKEGDDQISSQSNFQASVDMVREVVAERDELVVLLNQYKLLEQNLKREMSEQDVMIKAMKWSVSSWKGR